MRGHRCLSALALWFANHYVDTPGKARPASPKATRADVSEDGTTPFIATGTRSTLPAMFLQDSTEAIRRAARNVVPSRLYSLVAEACDAFWGTLRVGYPSYVRLRRLYPSCCKYDKEPVRFDLPQLTHPFFVRPGSSDAMCVMQNIIREEWGAFSPPEPVRLVVDAGANIGDTTARYLTRFPNATVVSLEPDPDNYAMLVRNCAAFGSRAVLLNAALWPRDARLNICPSVTYNAVSVAEVDSADGCNALMCDGVSVPALRQSLGFATIDILKCDIEGAEFHLFRDGAPWLSFVRCLVIEIHSEVAHQAVYKAVEKQGGFKSRRWRNTHIFWRFWR